MATYSDWEQRQLDISFSEEMDRIQERLKKIKDNALPSERLYECDACGLMKPDCSSVWVFGMECMACEECRDGE